MMQVAAMRDWMQRVADLQLFKLFDKLWTEYIHASAELLTNLDESGTQLDQSFPHPHRQLPLLLLYPIRRHALCRQQDWCSGDCPTPQLNAAVPAAMTDPGLCLLL
jgi:hypothetical protein